MVHVGQHVYKTTSRRHAQVAAITATHAILYWPHNDTQTEIKPSRFNRRSEWILEPDHHTSRWA
jgi:hypothetical protein